MNDNFDPDQFVDQFRTEQAIAEMQADNMRARLSDWGIKDKDERLQVFDLAGKLGGDLEQAAKKLRYGQFKYDRDADPTPWKSHEVESHINDVLERFNQPEETQKEEAPKVWETPEFDQALKARQRANLNNPDAVAEYDKSQEPSALQQKADEVIARFEQGEESNV